MANNEMIRILCKVKKECNPSLDTLGNYWRQDCILHKYLLCVSHSPAQVKHYGSNCAGGYICEGIQKRLGLRVTTMCPTIHKNVYNIIKKSIRETRI